MSGEVSCVSAELSGCEVSWCVSCVSAECDTVFSCVLLCAAGTADPGLGCVGVSALSAITVNICQSETYQHIRVRRINKLPKFIRIKHPG